MSHVAEIVFNDMMKSKPFKILHSFCNYSLFLFGLFLLYDNAYAQAQTPIGGWKTHFSYHDARFLAAGEKLVLCATDHSLFAYEKSDNSIFSISRLAGLSDNDFSALAYNSHNKLFFIGYASGKFDFYSESGKVYSEDVLHKANLTVSKKIRNVVFYQDLAYLLGDFGVLIYDSKRKQIVDDYRSLGSEGNRISIFSGAISDEKLFLATSEGVISGGLTGNVNLKDFRNWERYENELPNSQSKIVIAADQKVIAHFDQDGFYSFENTSWQRIALNEFTEIKDAIIFQNELLVAHSSQVSAINLTTNLTSQLTSQIISNPTKLAVSQNQQLYIADFENGLLVPNGNDFNAIFPSGPYRNQPASIVHQVEELIVINGPVNFTESNDSGGFSSFFQGKWKNFTADQWGAALSLPEVVDLVDVTVLDGKYYFLSLTGDLLTWDGQDEINLIKNNQVGNFRFSSLTSYSGKLWASNYSIANPLFNWTANEGWQVVNLNLNAVLPSPVVELSATAEGIIYLLPQTGGLVLYSPLADTARLLRDQTNEGGFAGRDILSAARDLNGNLWMGSNNGTFYLRNVISAMEGTVNAFLPIFEGFFLLRGFGINAIAVDGANRKWMGTNQGAWLFSPNGEEDVLFFDKSNSPLPSDTILNISINQRSGEVFFLTPRGMVSYRSDAVSAPFSKSDLKIFPNPVYLSRNEFISMEGTGFLSEVKITDITGKLVHRGKSQGGRFSWNLNNYRGEKVNTGIYLVFSAQSDGQFDLTGKFVVLP